MQSRRSFLKQASFMACAFVTPRISESSIDEEFIMSVTGRLKPSEMKFTLPHEHVLVDFIGADKVNKSRYDANEVFNIALPILQDVKNKGCQTFVDCTPAYIGRDAALLKRLALKTKLNIITTTGYYGAAQEKYIPQHAYIETAEQLSSRWIGEWNDGIEGTGIKPGLIKTGVDKAPLSDVQKKLIDAAAITHLATGLVIGIHTGNGEAAEAELEILASRKVSPAARIWIHAQNETDKSYHIRAAQRGSWVSFDGVNLDSINQNVEFLQNMKDHELLSNVLVSQDSGWYHVGEPGGGKYNDYNSIFTNLIPALRQKGFTQKEIDTIFVANPLRAFAIKIRKTQS